MTDAILVALIVSIPTTLVAIGGLYVSLRTGGKADKIIEKTVEIHTLTDGNLNKVTASLDVALAKIDGLEKLVASMVAAKVMADRVIIKATSATKK